MSNLFILKKHGTKIAELAEPYNEKNLFDTINATTEQDFWDTEALHKRTTLNNEVHPYGACLLNVMLEEALIKMMNTTVWRNSNGTPMSTADKNETVQKLKRLCEMTAAAIDVDEVTLTWLP